MSKVTNLILTCSVSEKEENVISEIGKFKLGDNSLRIVSISDKKLPNGWYGGSKNMECNIFMGAYNYLNLDDFIHHLKLIDWEDPDCVQLFILQEHEYKFEMINLFEELTG